MAVQQLAMAGPGVAAAGAAGALAAGEVATLRQPTLFVLAPPRRQARAAPQARGRPGQHHGGAAAALGAVAGVAAAVLQQVAQEQRTLLGTVPPLCRLHEAQRGGFLTV